VNDSVNGALFDEKEPMALKRQVFPSSTSEKKAPQTKSRLLTLPGRRERGDRDRLQEGS
jgi:hypothetical protein